jgi:hypothetical protein
MVNTYSSTPAASVGRRRRTCSLRHLLPRDVYVRGGLSHTNLAQMLRIHAILELDFASLERGSMASTHIRNSNAMAPSLHGCCDPHVVASASRADADADAEPQIRYLTLMTALFPHWGRTGTPCVIFISRAKDGRCWERVSGAFCAAVGAVVAAERSRGLAEEKSVRCDGAWNHGGIHGCGVDNCILRRRTWWSGGRQAHGRIMQTALDILHTHAEVSKTLLLEERR